jgi:hypothetical protein
MAEKCGNRRSSTDVFSEDPSREKSVVVRMRGIGMHWIHSRVTIEGHIRNDGNHKYADGKPDFQ